MAAGDEAVDPEGGAEALEEGSVLHEPHVVHRADGRPSMSTTVVASSSLSASWPLPGMLADDVVAHPALAGELASSVGVDGSA